MFQRLLVAFGVMVLAACTQTTLSSSNQAAHATTTATAESDAHHALLGRLVGHWVSSGTIAGHDVVHDVDGAWTLQGKYVRLEEVSREKVTTGQPQYEATIFIGWLENAHHYVCIWLDNTEVASGNVTCTAAETADALPFEFRDEHGALLIATTFTYHRADDTWTMQIDNIDNGRHTPFALLTMRRR